MPRNKKPYKNLHDLTVDVRAGHIHGNQLHWYRAISKWITDKTVLDVGAARGDGMIEMMMGGAQLCYGIDPLPINSWVQKTTLDDYFWDGGAKKNSYDVIVAMDVVEHVEFDNLFIAQMIYLAKEYVFFTTPNWNKSHCSNPYHIREYTPKELSRLLHGLDYRLLKSGDNLNIEEITELKPDDSFGNFGVLIKVSK